MNFSIQIMDVIFNRHTKLKAVHESSSCAKLSHPISVSRSLCVQMASNDPDLPDSLADPQPGDLIEIFRPAYQHWALYLGDGYIINLTPVGQ